MPMRINAENALSRSRNYHLDELEEYRYLSSEVASLETEVSRLITQEADRGKTSVIYNFATKDKKTDKETFMKAKLMCEELHYHGFDTSIFFDDYEGSYPTGYRVVILWE